jgi:hypothetical protein
MAEIMNRKVHKRLVKTRSEFDEWKEILNKKNTAEALEFDPLTRSVSVLKHREFLYHF